VELSPGDTLQICLDITNVGQTETSTVAIHYQLPDELIIHAVSVAPQGVASIVGNSLIAVLGQLESGKSGVVTITVEVSSEVLAETPIDDLLERGHLAMNTPEALKSTDNNYSTDELAIKLSERRFWSFIPFVVRSGEQAEISVKVGSYQYLEGNYRIDVSVDGVLWQVAEVVFGSVASQEDQDHVDLIVNGSIMETKEVAFGNNEMQELVFSIDNLKTGEYSIDINGIRGEFTSSWWINWWLVAAVLATIIGLLVWFFVGRRIKRQRSPQG
jgi:hypothetical protein